MDRPESQPTKDMLLAYAIGTISSMTFDEEGTSHNYHEAEYGSHGCSFEYEVSIGLLGENGHCAIGENTLKHIELKCSHHSKGCWELKREAREICEEWNKWLKAEERDLKTFTRLKKKFQGV